MFKVGDGCLPDQTFEQDLAYIDTKLKGRRFVSRGDIVPSEITGILPEVAFIVPLYDEAGALMDISVKLEGTLLARFYGELTGRTIGDGLGGKVKDRILAAISLSLEAGCPVCAELLLESQTGRRVAVRSLYIPLSEDDKHIDGFFVHFRISYSAIGYQSSQDFKI